MQGKGAHSLEIKYLHTCEKTICIYLDHQLKGLRNTGEVNPMHYKVKIPLLESLALFIGDLDVI